MGFRTKNRPSLTRVELMPETDPAVSYRQVQMSATPKPLSLVLGSWLSRQQLRLDGGTIPLRRGLQPVVVRTISWSVWALRTDRLRRKETSWFLTRGAPQLTALAALRKVCRSWGSRLRGGRASAGPRGAFSFFFEAGKLGIAVVLRAIDTTREG